MSNRDGQQSTPPISDDSPSLRSVRITHGGALQTEGQPALTKFQATEVSKPIIMEGSSSPSWGLRKEWSASVAPVWVVRAEDLEPIPNDFPLEKTHREIYEDPAVVCTRIAETLKSLSVESKYCSETAKVTCKTDDCVTFKIRLFAGGDDGGQPLIVEVQKRSGPSLCFLRTCRAILNAVEGGQQKEGRTANKSHERSGMLPKMMFPKPLRQMSCLRGVYKEPNNSDDITTEEVASVKRLMGTKRNDEHILALERLCCLTDPIKSSPLTSLQVSKALLQDEVLRDEVLISQPNQMLTDLARHADYFDRATHLSLTALSNACGLCGSNGCLAELLSEDVWFRNTLTPLLFTVLSQAESRATSAYHAARCLKPVLVASRGHQNLLHAVEHGKDILTTAHTFGSRFHELLQAETEQCLRELQENACV